MTPEQKQAELNKLRWWLEKLKTWTALRRNDVAEAEVEIYRLQGDIERLENEGGDNA